DEPDPDGQRHRLPEVRRLEPPPDLLRSADDLPVTIDVARERLRFVRIEVRSPRTTHLAAFVGERRHRVSGDVAAWSSPASTQRRRCCGPSSAPASKEVPSWTASGARAACRAL